MTKKSPRNFLFRAMRKCVRVVFDSNSAIWFEKDLASAEPCRRPLVPVSVVHSTEDTISWIRGHGEKWMRNENEFKAARQEGHLYAYMKHNNRVIGYIKAGMNRVYIDDLKQCAAFPPQCAFFYDIYVDPAFRGQGLAVFLAGHTMVALKEKGFTRVRLHIPQWNAASLSVARSLGFKPYASMRVFRFMSCITIKDSRKYEKAF